jgi:hypothetical protein
MLSGWGIDLAIIDELKTNSNHRGSSHSTSIFYQPGNWWQISRMIAMSGDSTNGSVTSLKVYVSYLDAIGLGTIRDHGSGGTYFYLSSLLLFHAYIYANFIYRFQNEFSRRGSNSRPRHDLSVLTY